MSRVLVAYASKMGATREIASVIGTELQAAGHRVDIRAADQVGDVYSYNTVVLGSAIYLGRWRREAVDLLRRHAEAMAHKRVWLFHSGPCGGRADLQVPPPRDVRRLARLAGAAPPVTFGGRLDPVAARGFFVRHLASGLQAGDYRDWDRIRDWAHTIGARYAWHR
jgi:menaquinone-dependent protoporphyrinogen oxidase